MSNLPLRWFFCGAAMAAGVSLMACTNGIPIGYVDPDAPGKLDPGPGCAEAPRIMEAKCLPCHSKATSPTFGGFDLETQPLGPRLVGVRSPGASATSMCGGRGPYLVAGSSPARGLLLDKIDRTVTPPCGSRMPQVGVLTAEEFECMQRWATQLVAFVNNNSDAGVDVDPGAADAGSQPDSNASNPAPDAISLDTAPDASEPPISIPPELLGTWTGYFEAYTLGSGSDAIKISLQRLADGSGRVETTLGPEMSLPPVTDPAAPWPTTDYALIPFVKALSPVTLEGVAYRAHNIRLVGRRLRFEIDGGEAWQPWCVRQTVYPAPGTPTGYSCIPSGTIITGIPNQCFVTDAKGTDHEISCARALMCGIGNFCSCYGDGCVGISSPTDTFDMTFDANGTSVSGTAVGRSTIRLMKTAP